MGQRTGAGWGRCLPRECRASAAALRRRRRTLLQRSSQHGQGARRQRPHTQHLFQSALLLLSLPLLHAAEGTDCRRHSRARRVPKPIDFLPIFGRSLLRRLRRLLLPRRGGWLDKGSSQFRMLKGSAAAASHQWCRRRRLNAGGPLASLTCCRNDGGLAGCLPFRRRAAAWTWLPHPRSMQRSLLLLALQAQQSLQQRQLVRLGTLGAR